MPDFMGPIRKTRFEVEIGGGPAGDIVGFKRIDMPSGTTEKNDYREGNDPFFTRQLWGQTSYDDLVMERGAKKGDTKLWDWRKQVVDGKMMEARQTVTINILDAQQQVQLKYQFSDCWPKEYRPPSLSSSAGGGNNVATETVVLTFNEMERVQ